MKYYCDECIAELVRSGKVRPLSQVYYTQLAMLPCKRGVRCDRCGRTGSEHEGFYEHREIDEYIINGIKKDESKSENHERPDERVLEFWKHAKYEAETALNVLEEMEKKGLTPEFWICESASAKVRIPIDERGAFMHYMREVHKTQYAKYKYFLDKNGGKV